MNKQMEKMDRSCAIDMKQCIISDGEINNLNEDCLIYIFQYLPIMDRVKIERGI